MASPRMENRPAPQRLILDSRSPPRLADYANSTLSFLPIADAARSRVASVTDGLAVDAAAGPSSASAYSTAKLEERKFSRSLQERA